MQDNIRRFRWQKAGETSAADLLRECGEKLTDRGLWAKFQERFQGLIFLYLLRALRLRGIQEDAAGIVQDLAQEVIYALCKTMAGYCGHSEGLRSFQLWLSWQEFRHL